MREGGVCASGAKAHVASTTARTAARRSMSFTFRRDGFCQTGHGQGRLDTDNDTVLRGLGSTVHGGAGFKGCAWGERRSRRPWTPDSAGAGTGGYVTV